MFSYLLQGLVLGLLVSIPIGPVNVICLYETTHKGRLYGFASTLGGTIADTIYALIASFGVNAFIKFIETHRSFFEISSGGIILTFGLLLVLRKSKDKQETQTRTFTQNAGVYFKSFFFTISNPLTVLFFVAYLANTKLPDSGFSPRVATSFVVGVLLGSLTWFYSLSGIVAHYKERLKLKHFKRINTICGAVLCITGIVFFIKSIVMT